jgi:hypothetical protein
MPALAGSLLGMNTGNSFKVTGKENAAGWSMTTTGTMIETGTFVRKRKKGRGTTTAGN